MKRVWQTKAQKDVFITLLLSSGVSVGLLCVRIFVTGTTRLSFLLWNLFLAWLPLIFAFWLKVRLTGKKLPTWKELIIGGAWLFFLPNSFYLVSDLIHLQSSGEVSLLYDTALIVSFVINGMMLGFLSLYLVQQTAKKYLGSHLAYIFAQSVLLLSGFAIYLGRYLRWNTWDVVINPAGLVFDVSDRIINPVTHTHTFVVTAVFYVLLGSTYAVLYRLAEIARTTSKH